MSNRTRHPKRIYHPIVRAVLKLRWLVVVAAAAVVLVTIPVYRRFGSEFMPPLNEGSILYMPITLPRAGSLPRRDPDGAHCFEVYAGTPIPDLDD